MRDEPLTVTTASGNGEGVTILALNGPLTLQNSFDFQRELSQHKPAVLIIDLTESPYMDSAGLGLLMNCYVSAEKNGRRLLLAGVNERIHALLQMTKVHLILKNYPTAADAEASVRA
ncbi:MAG TPA: STAS domain-containing protein [Acidobacteriaceae bacterium]|jgi:anti-anti-sigma factor|nr:STAS domain-containing protein [Acidobacteriaceae bacterium]